MKIDNLVEIRECTEQEYLHNKEFFNAAVKSGLISEPEKFEKRKISHAGGFDVTYGYRWKVLDR